MKALIDTREKIPFNIYINEYITEIANIKLNAGDYSIDTLEEIVAIERKRTVLEFAQNITTERFWNTISRLEEVRHPIILFEFPIDHLYRYPDIPTVINNSLRDKLKIKPPFLISSIGDIILKKINVIFAGDSIHAEKIANDFLCKIIKRYKK